MQTSRPRVVFISYRREDTKAVAGRLYDRLAAHFGRERVFMDVDSIHPGRDFVEEVTSFIASCDALIALIGSGWLGSGDVDGQRRIHDPGDFVRLEIETALRSDVAVIPVLVEEAERLRVEDLPLSLRKLLRHQELRLTHEDFLAQTSRLIDSIERLPRRERARVVATSIGFRWMRIILRLNQPHRITLDCTRALTGRIDVDDTVLYKGFFDFAGEHRFSIQDDNRSVPASLFIQTSGKDLSHVILIVDGRELYDSSSSAAQEPAPWREGAIVMKATPRNFSVMYIVLKLQEEHTIGIEQQIGHWFARIYVDGQLALRKFDITGENSFFISDGNRRVPASVAIDMGPLNNMRKVVLTIDGAIAYES